MMLMHDAEPFYYPASNQIGGLLIHGFTGTPKEMRGLGKFLWQQGLTVAGIRLFGHGTTPKDMIRARWQDWFASVEDGYYLLKNNVKKVFLIGLSMGGVLSLTFASKYPVSGIVAMSTPHHLPNDPRLRIIKLISLVKPYFPKDDPQWHDQKVLNEHICYSVDPTRSYAELDKLIKEMQYGLPNVTAPTLLINSVNDPTVTSEEHHIDYIYDAIGSMIKRKLLIEDSGHVITSDKQRKTVYNAVYNFIQEIQTSQLDSHI